MDELKIVFYVVVAIAWVIYNNYRKFSEAARKRDISSPPQTTEDKREPVKSPLPARPKTIVRPAMQKIPIPVRKPKLQPKKNQPFIEKRKSAEPVFFESPVEIEGGSVVPSRLVQFEDASNYVQEENPVLLHLKLSGINGLKTGFIWSEILKRPYY